MSSYVTWKGGKAIQKGLLDSLDLLLNFQSFHNAVNPAARRHEMRLLNVVDVTSRSLVLKIKDENIMWKTTIEEDLRIGELFEVDKKKKEEEDISGSQLADKTNGSLTQWCSPGKSEKRESILGIDEPGKL